VPTAAERDGQQLLLHRHKLVRMRTQVQNQWQALALNQGVQRKWKLWSAVGRKQLESLPLLPWASRRRAELLQLLDPLEVSIGELDRAVAEPAYVRTARGAAMDDPSGRGTGHGAGVHADQGAGGTFWPRSRSSKLEL
jgi:transposase